MLLGKLIKIKSHTKNLPFWKCVGKFLGIRKFSEKVWNDINKIEVISGMLKETCSTTNTNIKVSH